MPPKGNKNAEKWTEETTLKAIERIHKYNVKNKKNYHLGLSIIETGLYPQWWSEMATKFKENNLVSESIKKAEAFLEARIINSTMSGEARGQAMAIFYLKNKHDYKDKTETDITSKGESIIPQSPEERQKEIEELIEEAKKK